MTAIDNLLNPFQFYTIPLDDWINSLINFVVDRFRPVFQVIGLPIRWTLQNVEGIFNAIPPLIFIIVIALISWKLAGTKTAFCNIISLTLIGFIGVWEQAMISLSLVITALVFCLVVGIPLGIICAKSDRTESLIRPLLDIMQTLPSFVYLVPVVMLFGIGEVPGVIATIIFAIPPLIRRLCRK